THKAFGCSYRLQRITLYDSKPLRSRFRFASGEIDGECGEGFQSPAGAHLGDGHECVLADHGDRARCLGPEVGGADGLALHQSLRLRGTDPDDGKQCAGRLGQRDEFARGRVEVLGQAHGPVEFEVADADAAQRSEVAEDTEVGADIAAQGTHIGARGAVDLDVDVDMALIGGEADVDDLECGDLDPAGLQLDVLAGPDSGVGASAIDLDRRYGAGDLVDEPALSGDRSLDGCRVDGGQGLGTGEAVGFGVGVVGRCRRAQANGRQIGLRYTGDVAEQLGAAPESEHEHTGGHRVEGSGMADLLRPVPAAHT